MLKKLLYLSAFVLIAALLADYYMKISQEKLAKDIVEWAEKNKISIDKSKTRSTPFRIAFDQNEWDALLKKLEQTRYFEPLDSKIVSKFENGFNSEYARELVEHWRSKFNWSERVNYLNKFPQFKIDINGTKIHYVHVVTNAHKNLNKVPVLLVDGWPGSFFGFYKMIDYLNDNFSQYSFSIIIPSIPGYLYSTPLNKNVNAVDSALIFDALMRFLFGESVRYYAHGEDWGALISTSLANLFPQRIKGIHLTAVVPFESPDVLVYSLIGNLFPSYFYTQDEINKSLVGRYSIGNMFAIMLKETAYMHMHATYPDTLAHALSDSPVGLLAHILEKYSKWSFNNDRDILNKHDGSLNKYEKDDLLTIITLYWMTNSISSSIRFYKNQFKTLGAEYPINSILKCKVSPRVAVGNQFFENEIFFIPEKVVRKHYPNLIQNTIINNGGHFAAFQNPVLSAQDFVKFISSTL